MSRNPFRKARDNQAEVTPSDDLTASTLFDLRVPQTEQPKSQSTKKKKKVVIKTPPRSPEEPQRRLSLGRPPSPVPKLATNAFNPYDDAQDMHSATDVSIEEAVSNARRNSAGTMSESDPTIPVTVNSVKAPFNPFARTLATSEDKYGIQKEQQVPDNAGGRTKPVIDVDMFKNILMNGVAPPVDFRARSQAPQENIVPKDTLQDGFETRYPDLNTQVLHRSMEALGIPEAETSSDEEAESIQSERQAADNSSVRAPQIVSFDDFKGVRASSLETPRDLEPDVQPARRYADIEKPLPPAPEMHAIDTAIAPSAEQSTPKSGAPPPPPAARRQAHSSSTTGRRRSSSVMSRSSIRSEASSITPQLPTTLETANASKAPPPPPTRRSGPGRPASESEPLASPVPERSSMAPPPAPAPRRAPIKTSPSDKRSSSNHSRSSLQPLTEGAGSNVAPPRPPPRRAGDSNRSSVDGSLFVRRTSGQDSRRVSNDLDGFSTLQNPPESRADLLSDLAALQKEVDELRAKAAGR